MARCVCHYLAGARRLAGARESRGVARAHPPQQPLADRRKVRLAWTNAKHRCSSLCHHQLSFIASLSNMVTRCAPARPSSSRAVVVVVVGGRERGEAEAALREWRLRRDRGVDREPVADVGVLALVVTVERMP